MPQESIEIRTTKEKFFHEYLMLKKPIIDAILTKLSGHKKTLSEIPRTVLAQLLYYNDAFKDYPEEEKWRMVFNQETKKMICESLDMKEHSLNIYFTKLRELKILNGKTINKLFIVYAGADHTLNFNFKLNGHT